MDTAGADKDQVLADLNEKLAANFVDFDEENDDFLENIATGDEDLLEKYLETNTIGKQDILSTIAQRKVFPVYFGSALKMEGINEFLVGLNKWAQEPNYSDNFGLRVFKISHDEKGRAPNLG